MTEIRHGYTLDALHNLARTCAFTAARTAGPVAVNYDDRYDTAWSAIVERLYAEPEPPLDKDLIGIGCNAIWRSLRAAMHCWGLTYADDGGLRQVGHYERYWRHHARACPSAEEAVVDELALHQILPRLTDLHREALMAYIAHNHSISEAAGALGINVKAMSARLDYARARFLALWHEHEQPSRKWRKQGTRRPDHKLVPCGTDSAYFRHWRRGESIDDACREAHAAAKHRPNRYPRTRSDARAADRQARSAA